MVGTSPLWKGSVIFSGYRWGNWTSDNLWFAEGNESLHVAHDVHLALDPRSGLDFSHSELYPFKLLIVYTVFFILSYFLLKFSTFFWVKIIFCFAVTFFSLNNFPGLLSSNDCQKESLGTIIDTKLIYLMSSISVSHQALSMSLFSSVFCKGN